MRFGWLTLSLSPSPEEDMARIDQQIAQICAAELLGFEDVWLTEHYFTGESVYNDALLFAAAVAMRTERIRIGFAVVQLPFHHPVGTIRCGACRPGIPLANNLRSRQAGRHDQNVDPKPTNRPPNRSNLTYASLMIVYWQRRSGSASSFVRFGVSGRFTRFQAFSRRRRMREKRGSGSSTALARARSGKTWSACSCVRYSFAWAPTSVSRNCVRRPLKSASLDQSCGMSEPKRWRIGRLRSRPPENGEGRRDRRLHRTPAVRA